MDYGNASTTSTGSNSNKRHGGAPSGMEPTSKKRAPYTSRACDACRRRKGRCSGDNPCTYCVARSLECTGAGGPSSYPADSSMSDVPPEPSSQSQPQSHSHPGQSASAGLATPAPTLRASTSTSTAPPPTGQLSSRPSLSTTETEVQQPQNAQSAEERTLTTLTELVASLQQQVGTLTTRMQSMEQQGAGADAGQGAGPGATSHPHPEHQPNPRGYTRLSHARTASITASSEAMVVEKEPSPRQHMARRSAHRRRYCGPTSPDYSLNVAQNRLHLGADLPHHPGRPGLPSINDNDSEDADSLYSPNEEDEGDSASVQASSREMGKLTGFTRLITRQDAVRLAHTYQEVFGDFHPILDVETMIRQTSAWYDTQSRGQQPSGPYQQQKPEEMAGDVNGKPPTDETCLVIINLVLAIALCAEPTSDVDVAKAIYTYSQDTINRKLASHTPGVRHAVIAHLVGVYHFFRDDARFAWRMCGLAGNMLLELGLHSHEIPENMLGSAFDRNHIVALICTTIVLDRQWSAATGLPTHFQESHFHQTMKASVESPYLKGMVAFMAISDKFTALISRFANAAQSYEEDDTFEIINLQIEQWRKNSVGEYNMTQHGAWRTLPISRIPAWAILLNLRANAAHAMLLRPFFFTNKPTPVSRKNIEPALNLSADSINILWNLDKSTDIYRKQLPFYIHLLVSACALLALVIAHVTEHRTTLEADLPEDFVESVSKSFRKALSMTATYSRSSRASRKLWKRLVHIQEPLIRLGVLPPEQGPGRAMSNDEMSSNPQSEESGRPQGQADPWTTRWARTQEPVSVQQGREAMPVQARVVPIGPPNHRDGGENGSGMYPQQPVPGEYVQDMSGMPGPMGMPGPPMDASSTMMPFGPGGTLFGDWPLVDGHNFFSEGELLYQQ